MGSSIDSGSAQGPVFGRRFRWLRSRSAGAVAWHWAGKKSCWKPWRS